MIYGILKEYDEWTHIELLIVNHTLKVTEPENAPREHFDCSSLLPDSEGRLEKNSHF